VTLKLLPMKRLADAVHPQRIVQEAKSASELNHSNIIHIYDVAERTTLLAMTCVWAHVESNGRKALALGCAPGKPA
jgi:hypothetical protein